MAFTLGPSRSPSLFGNGRWCWYNFTYTESFASFPAVTQYLFVSRRGFPLRTVELTTRTFYNKFSKLNFWTLQVDHTSLETFILKQNPTLFVRGLVPALLNWLRDPHERAFVWERCLPAHGQNLRFPVLMCSEDIDLSCHLVVVDVSADSEYVYWHRMAAGCSGLELPETGDDLVWANWAPIRFNRHNYTEILNRYRVYLDGAVNGVVYPPADGERVETYEIHERNSAASGG